MDSVKQTALKHLDDARRAILADNLILFENHSNMARHCINGEAEMYESYVLLYKLPGYWKPQKLTV